MAAAASGAWGKPGAWALDSEENAAELLEQNKEGAPAVTGGETAEFPSLSAAKTKKKKPQTLSLHEFSSYGAVNPAATAQLKGLTPEELRLLPTGPRQRSAEELDRNKLGGGFRSYGGGPRDEQPRRQGSSNREFAPSRADETDNWGAGKKFTVNNKGERGGFITDSQSRADEVENWASNKNLAPSEPRRLEKRVGFGMGSGNKGADSSNWANKRDEGSGGSGGNRPRLNLQPRTLPVGEGEKSEIIVSVIDKPKGKSLFGEARPREEVLKEKSRDCKEVEEKLQSVKINEVVSDGKKSFRGGNGKERLQQEDKFERSWRRPELASSRSESAGETEIEPADND